MPKRLVLVRHAKSDKTIPGQKDFDRSLSDKGHLDAHRMGHLLSEMDIKFDAIISSPAERAKLTAQYFCEQLKIDIESIIYNENIYEASTRILMSEVCAIDDKFNIVMVFGHNPGFSYLAEYLTKEIIGDIPTCSILVIDLAIDHWIETSQGLGKLVSMDFPKE